MTSVADRRPTLLKARDPVDPPPARDPVLQAESVRFSLKYLFPDWEDVVTIPLFVDADSPSDYNAFLWWRNRLQTEAGEGLRVELVRDEPGGIWIQADRIYSIYSTFCLLKFEITIVHDKLKIN